MCFYFVIMVWLDSAAVTRQLCYVMLWRFLKRRITRRCPGAGYFSYRRARKRRIICQKARSSAPS